MSPYRVMQLGSPTGLYGAERWILALVRHLDPAEVESIVSVIRDDPALEAALCTRARELGLHAHVIEAYGKANWSAVRSLRQFILEHDVQILHTHGYKTDVIGLLATRRTPCRLISTPHGWTAQANLSLRIYETLDRLIFPWFDAVVPLSASMCADLQRWPGLRNKLLLIRNGLDIGEIDAANGLASEIAQWKSNGAFVVGYIGRLIPAKGLVALLDAFALLDLPSKKLAIVGEGPQREELEAYAAAKGLRECVSFFGFRSDRLAFLKGFDVFVLPSRSEGIPRCLMEAMAASVAVLASDIPGCAALVRHEETGLLFPVDDASALHACLEACLNPATRARLAQRARELVAESYSAATMAHLYQGLYRQLLSGADSLQAECG